MVQTEPCRKVYNISDRQYLYFPGSVCTIMGKYFPYAHWNTIFTMMYTLLMDILEEQFEQQAIPADVPAGRHNAVAI